MMIIKLKFAQTIEEKVNAVLCVSINGLHIACCD